MSSYATSAGSFASCFTGAILLDRKLFFLRSYGSFNDSRFDLSALVGANRPLVLPFQQLGNDVAEDTAALLSTH